MNNIAATAAVLLVFLPAAALAKEATCYTTDYGEYPCEFVGTAGDGSFEISAAGYPFFAVVMERPGVAWVYGTYEEGGRSVALPGPYIRSTDDPACWRNADTEVELCAW